VCARYVLIYLFFCDVASGWDDDEVVLEVLNDDSLLNELKLVDSRGPINKIQF
jgi:hypothetical protein